MTVDKSKDYGYYECEKAIVLRVRNLSKKFKFFSITTIIFFIP